MEKKPLYNPLLGDFEEFYNNNVNLMYKFVNDYRRRSSSAREIPYEDLIQEANVGFVKAYIEYDGRSAFSTFVYYKIHGELTIYMRRASPMPSSEYTYRMSGVALRKGLKYATAEEISDKLGCSLVAANNIIQHLHRKINYMWDENVFYERSVYADHTNVHIEEFLTSLTAREKRVLEGWLRKEPIAEVARVIRTGKANVGHIRNSIKRKAEEYFGGMNDGNII